MKVKKIQYILLLALLVRLLFVFYGAEKFYGKSDFYINGDTYSFMQPMMNLVDEGVFSLDLNKPEAAFARLPGYSMLLSPFYLLFGSGKAFFMAVMLFQLLLDCLSCYLVYRIVCMMQESSSAALVTAFLFAIYPFVIVWTPVVYAETAGIFLMLLFVYLIQKRSPALLVGLVLAAGFFVRPQLLFLLPAYFLALLVTEGRHSIRKMMTTTLGFLLLYSAWPIRNFVNHDAVVLMRDITSMRSWQNDVLYFHKYMNALQPGWEPQMTQLISNRKVELPEGAATSVADSILLDEMLEQSVNCSDGFASFMKRPPLLNNCTETTAEGWKTLYEAQMRNRPFNYFIVVPLKGLRKAIFKFKLISNWKSPDRSTFVVFLTSSLFIFRSILIVFGLFSLWYLMRNGMSGAVDRMILFFFLIWYFWLIWITRYLEIRYFLPADVLLLIPLSRYLARKKVFLTGSQPA